MRRNISCGRGLLSGFSLNVFSEEECERIHLATLEPPVFSVKANEPSKFLRPAAAVSITKRKS